MNDCDKRKRKRIVITSLPCGFGRTTQTHKKQSETWETEKASIMDKQRRDPRNDKIWMKRQSTNRKHGRLWRHTQRNTHKHTPSSRTRPLDRLRDRQSPAAAPVCVF